jgi:hypothetical protein
MTTVFAEQVAGVRATWLENASFKVSGRGKSDLSAVSPFGRWCRTWRKFWGWESFSVVASRAILNKLYYWGTGCPVGKCWRPWQRRATATMGNRLRHRRDGHCLCGGSGNRYCITMLFVIIILNLRVYDNRLIIWWVWRV